VLCAGESLRFAQVSDEQDALRPCSAFRLTPL